MQSLSSLPKDASLTARWAVIFHDIGKPETFKIAERIRFDNHSSISAEIAEKIMRRLKFPRREIEKNYLGGEASFYDDRTFENATWSTKTVVFERRIS